MPPEKNLTHPAAEEIAAFLLATFAAMRYVPQSSRTTAILAVFSRAQSPRRCFG
jgi:hypothetical protein